VRFPARGFAKVLSDEAAQVRLSVYRSILGKESNQSLFHNGFSMEISLRHMPRRGDESFCLGTITGPYLGSGLSRVTIDPMPGMKSKEIYLLKNGKTPKLWRSIPRSSESLQISPTESLKPLVPGMNQTAFDLLMPFVFWEGTYQASGKVAGRPAHLFSFSCPAWMAREKPNWSRITLALDDTYEAPLRVEILGVDSVPIRTLILRSFKKIKDRWIVKEIDCRDRETRSVTRMKITSAALNLDFAPSIFSPSGFTQRIQIDPKLYTSTD
jgi:hypothetical protein